MLNIFRTKTQADPLDVLASLATKLNEARGNLAALQMRHGEVALGAELEGTGEGLDGVVSEIGKAKARISSLEAAKTEAEKRIAEAQRMRAEAEWKRKVDAYKDKLERHAVKGDKLRKAISDLADAYKQFVASGGECLNSEPNHALPPYGSIMDPHSIHDAVAMELARLQTSNIGDTEKSRIPGSEYPRQVYDEREIKPFHEAVIDSNSFALKTAQQKRPRASQLN